MANADYENANQALRTKLAEVTQKNSRLQAELDQLKSEIGEFSPKLSEDPLHIGDDNASNEFH